MRLILIGLTILSSLLVYSVPAHAAYGPAGCTDAPRWQYKSEDDILADVKAGAYAQMSLDAKKAVAIRLACANETNGTVQVWHLIWAGMDLQSRATAAGQLQRYFDEGAFHRFAWDVYHSINSTAGAQIGMYHDLRELLEANNPSPLSKANCMDGWLKAKNQESAAIKAKHYAAALTYAKTAIDKISVCIAEGRQHQNLKQIALSEFVLAWAQYDYASAASLSNKWGSAHAEKHILVSIFQFEEVAKNPNLASDTRAQIPSLLRDAKRLASSNGVFYELAQ